MATNETLIRCQWCRKLHPPGAVVRISATDGDGTVLDSTTLCRACVRPASVRDALCTLELAIGGEG